ncbi:hypothetical protein BO71DRAFT_43134 [Aspergillus ellipticus CBS 707.79]|uniref:RING-type domain-containing protein n=1 Tax=Aspergillus ellipticus CBS 707.79 TaxID=1448320 RepID=A0A319DUF6_9EURO|nr:hypothetical protein BO71DRAFT_43134 [Aspergillus ellipticus CBS 707.79]
MDVPQFPGPRPAPLALRQEYANDNAPDLIELNPDLDFVPQWAWEANDFDWNLLDTHFPRPVPEFERAIKKQKQASPTGSTFSGVTDDKDNDFQSGLTPTTLHPGATIIDLTADDSLLTQITDIFPDISQKYVEELIDRHQAPMHHGQDGRKWKARPVEPDITKEQIIEEILQTPCYPKQDGLKRKIAEIQVDDKQWMANIPNRGSPLYIQLATTILAQEFLWMPVNHIRQIVNDKKELYAAYLTLYTQANEPDKQYAKLKRERQATAASPPTRNNEKTSTMENLKKELAASKKEAHIQADVSQKQKEEQEAELQNEEEHTRTGNLVECQCCYSDVPANRSLPCEGVEVHFFCYTCIRKSAETQIGLMKYQLQCFDTSGCQAKFSRTRLEKALGPNLMKKIDSLQQQDEIQQAGLEGLEDCPFCEFKAICPPVEEDREFRCSNPTCEQISCRICHQESHIPKTCEEARKERGLPERHLVEEAMSEALIRTCPKCNVKIVKEFGCNKMICSKCSCAMCYVCKKNITREQYNHFGRPPTFCRTHDEAAENRSQDEIEHAQKTAIESLLAQNPELTEEELRVHDDKAKEAPPAQQRQYAPRREFDELMRLHAVANRQGRIRQQAALAQEQPRVNHNRNPPVGQEPNPPHFFPLDGLRAREPWFPPPLQAGARGNLDGAAYDPFPPRAQQTAAPGIPVRNFGGGLPAGGFVHPGGGWENHHPQPRRLFPNQPRNQARVQAYTGLQPGVQDETILFPTYEQLY